MTNKTLLARIASALPFLKPDELRIAERKRKLERDLKDQGVSRSAAMRAISKRFPKVAKHHEK